MQIFRALIQRLGAHDFGGISWSTSQTPVLPPHPLLIGNAHRYVGRSVVHVPPDTPHSIYVPAIDEKCAPFMVGLSAVR